MTDVIGSIPVDYIWYDILSFFLCVSVENGEHCDFTVLRNMLIRWQMILQSEKPL